MKFMRYGLLRVIWPQTLDIGLESLIVGQGVNDEIQSPLGDKTLSAPLGQYSSSTNRDQYS